MPIIFCGTNLLEKCHSDGIVKDKCVILKNIKEIYFTNNYVLYGEKFLFECKVSRVTRVQTSGSNI